MKSNQLNHRLCVAPMMTHTDRHFRYFLRLISRHVLLYTEMITTGAIIYGKQFHRLEYDDSEHPLALQLGGSNPQELAQCAKIAEDMGYDEINLNVGCPSDRVQNGQFGACLMSQPDLVADCVQAMQQSVSIPVTVKTRTGIDHMDDYEFLKHFVHTISSAGCDTFIIHARKAWLSGLSPRQNREIPPLTYDKVYDIKADYPGLKIIINGGINSIKEAVSHLDKVDGVMMGRAICNNPYLLSVADSQLFDDETLPLGRDEIVSQYMDYIQDRLAEGNALQQMAKHILGLFQGQPGARKWRRYLSENVYRNNSGIEVIKDALKTMQAA
ncbi:MAG: tRNA dihydrouridine(20/20a) synthase DusA [Gammaproteobacteria bacterium]|nr:tRNA dihydrouridine(20/20a) synthase DusA [Gammaproteobacteria bacterium]